VKDVELTNKYTIKITLLVDNKLKIPKGSKTRLRSAGMSGEKELRIMMGPGPDHINEKEVIASEEVLATVSSAGEVGATVTLAKGALKTVDSIANSINDLVGGVRGKQQIKLQIDAINKQTLKASKQSFTIKGNGEKFAHKINSMDSSFAKTAANSYEWHKDIAKAEKQTYDMAKSTTNIQEDVRKLQDNFRSLRSAFAKVNTDTGTLGKWLNDKQPYNTTTRSWDTTNRSLKDVMAHPSAYWFAIFGKNSKKED
jgi:ABC-type transporter Mla subunit MlaD